jgi:hypothetical protein
VSYSIIHIPTKSCSIEIKSLVVLFIPHPITLGRVVERCRDHVRLLYGLPDGPTLCQELVASSVLPITEILAIEDHKLNNNLLHVTFRSRSLLEPTSDQTGSDSN